MDLLNIQLTQAKKIKGLGKSKPKDLLIYDIHRNDKKQISMALFKDTYKTFKKKYGEQNLMVRALNDTQWVTSENTQMHKKSAQTHKLGYTDAYTNEKSVDRARPLRTEHRDAQMHHKKVIIIFFKYMCASTYHISVYIFRCVHTHDSACTRIVTLKNSISLNIQDN